MRIKERRKIHTQKEGEREGEAEIEMYIGKI
jgi:hypothetical protein